MKGVLVYIVISIILGVGSAELMYRLAGYANDRNDRKQLKKQLKKQNRRR